jgi:hypothetical protein
MNIFYDQKSPNYIPKRCPQKTPENAFMNGYFYIYCVAKCGNRALGINECKKNLLRHKTNPIPPLLPSDRGPTRNLN